MHLFIIVDGNIFRLKQFENELWQQGQKENPNEDEISRKLYGEMCIREVRLLDISFPEECKERLIRDLGLTNKVKTRWSFLAGILRRILGLRRIPNIKPERKFGYRVHLIPLGLKEDKYIKGEEQI